MSSQNRKRFGFTWSVGTLALATLVVAVLALLVLSLLLGAWRDSGQVQTAAMPILAAATATLEPSPEPTEPPTLEPTPIPTIAPPEEWLTYTDEFEGFSIRYPEGWFLSELSLEVRQASKTYTTNIANYDANDPAVMDWKGPPPRHSFKLDIGISRSKSSKVLPGQSLEEWVHLNKVIGPNAELLEEGYVTIGDVEGYRQVWESPEGKGGVQIAVPRDDRMFFFYYWFYPESPLLAETAEEMLASFQFTR